VFLAKAIIPWQKSPQIVENKGRALQKCSKSPQLVENRGDASDKGKETEIGGKMIHRKS
jgi:hypothetical protein